MSGGQLLIQFTFLRFSRSILHSSFEGAGRAKCKAGLSKMRLAHFDGSGRLPPRGPFGSALNVGVHAIEKWVSRETRESKSTLY